MSTLANTIWTFNTQGTLAGTISFQQVGSSPNVGVATITATNPPPAYTGGGTWQASWAEAADGNNFTVQFNNFGNDLNFNPPPLGLVEINGAQIDAILITLFGSHTNGAATVYGTNFQAGLTVFTMNINN